MKVKVTCDWCGKVFEKNACKIKRHNYCSRGCLGKANGERLKKNRTQICDNCGKEFIPKSLHGARNQHLFCSPECAWRFRVKKSKIHCDWCGKSFWKKQSDIKRRKHNFCSWGCYLDYINMELAGAANQRVCGEVLYRYLARRKVGHALTTKEEVHHVDGNHLNNDEKNLMVVSKSEHARIHASQKEMDIFGRFIKKR